MQVPNESPKKFTGKRKRPAIRFAQKKKEKRFPRFSVGWIHNFS
jgi:hypothetical protein